MTDLSSVSLSFQPPIRDEPQVARLIEKLLQGDFQVRWDVAKQLIGYGVEILPKLVMLLETEAEDAELCWFIARILGELKHPRAIAILADLVSQAEQPELASVAAMALIESDRLAIPPLQALLNASETRLLAVQALAQLYLPEAMALLLEVAQDPNPSVRAAAVEALSGFRDRPIDSILIQSLQDDESPVRLAALRGLGSRLAALDPQTQSLELIPVLEEHLGDGNLEIAEQAAMVLGRLGTAAALMPLEQLLCRADPAARPPHGAFPVPERLFVQVIRALGWSHSGLGLQILQRQLVRRVGHLKTDPGAARLALEIIQVLGRVEDAAPPSPSLKVQATEILLAVLIPVQQQGTIQLQQAIAHSLGQLSQAIAFDPLVTYLAIPHVGVRWHVLTALKRLDIYSGKERLQALQASQEPGEQASEQWFAGVAFALKEWT